MTWCMAAGPLVDGCCSSVHALLFRCYDLYMRSLCIVLMLVLGFRIIPRFLRNDLDCAQCVEVWLAEQPI